MEVQGNCNATIQRLLDHVETKWTDQAQSTMTIPSFAYTDEARWRREMQLIFARLPLLAGLSAELPHAGDYKTLRILNKPLLIVRQADGTLRAMVNVCKHRAMIVADEEHGNCNRFTCPYHGWTYAGDGRLIAVAEAQKFGDVDKESLGLTPVSVYERAGLIFVADAPDESVDFENFLGDLITDLERFEFAHCHYAGVRELHGANWKVAYDGYLEGYHFATAHARSINQRTYSNIMTFEAYGPHLRIGFPQLSIDVALRNVPKEQWWARETEGYDFVRALFPNVLILVARELTAIAQILPGPTANASRTMLHYLCGERPAGPEEEAALTRMIDWHSGVVRTEDYQVGLKVQLGLESGGIDRIIFGRNERGNQYFHRCVNYYLADDPSAPLPDL